MVAQSNASYKSLNYSIFILVHAFLLVLPVRSFSENKAVPASYYTKLCFTSSALNADITFPNTLTYFFTAYRALYKICFP